MTGSPPYWVGEHLASLGAKKFKPQNSTLKEPPIAFNKNIAQIEPLKCWESDRPHYFKDFPVRKNFFNFHSIQKAVIVGDMARSMPIICFALEYRKADHQTSMVKIEGSYDLLI